MWWPTGSTPAWARRTPRRSSSSSGGALAAKVLIPSPTSAASPRDRANLDDLRGRLRRRPMIEVPYFDEDVHDLEGLLRMDEYLFAGD